MNISPKDVTIYVIGRNTAIFAIANILNLKKLYPEFQEQIIYVDDHSVDNTIELMQKYSFNYQVVPEITQAEIDSFHLKSEGIVYSVRLALNYNRTLEKCNTKYAIIMHADMFVLDSNFLYQLLDDLTTAKVSSVALNQTSKEEATETRRICIEEGKKFLDTLSPSEYKDNLTYYYEHYLQNDLNKVWAGLMAIDLNYFKENNLPYGDRLDNRNKDGLEEFFLCDTLQDFQCFLVDNDIPFKSYEDLNSIPIYHIFHASILNTDYYEDIIEKKIFVPNFFENKENFKPLKLISENTGISLRQLSKGLYK